MPCLAHIKYFVEARVSPEPYKRRCAELCGLPVHRSVLLAICEVRKGTDVGFKITPKWATAALGRKVFRALEGSGVWTKSSTDLLRAVNGGNTVTRCEHAALQFDNVMSAYPINVSSDAITLPETERHMSHLPVVPVVACDPRRHPVQPSHIDKGKRISKRMQRALHTMHKHVYFTNCYNQSSSVEARYL